LNYKYDEEIGKGHGEQNKIRGKISKLGPINKGNLVQREEIETQLSNKAQGRKENKSKIK